MAFFQKTRPFAIGCAVSGDAVRMVQLRPGGIVTGRAAHGSGAGSKDASLSIALQNAYNGAAFEGDDVVVCAPMDLTSFRRMSLALMPHADLVKAVHWQAAKEAGRQPEEICVDYYHAGESVEAGKQRHELIAVTACAAGVREYLSPIQKAQLTPIALDTEPGALARCLTLHDSEETPRIVTLLGKATSLIFTVCQGEPKFIHPLLQHGLGQTPETGSSRERNNLVSELARQIKVCQHYLSERHPAHLVPTQGCIAGAGDLEDEIIQGLNGSLDITFAPLAESVVPGVRRLLAALPDDEGIDDWLIPIGLAFYGREEMCRDAA